MDLGSRSCTEGRSTAPCLKLDNVAKHFDNGTVAVAGVTLNISRGSFVSLLGPSGCGKSTVLRLVAGLAKPSIGSVTWPQSASAKERPCLSYVFQDATLMPWASALKNVMLPLLLARIPGKEAKKEAQCALAEVGLDKFASAYPTQLSGGMRMRVSLARALVTQPQILLLDEPFAALDEITRARLNQDLAELWRARKFTAIFVTHSVFEAAYLSQRVIIMAANPGRIFVDCPVVTESERNEAFRSSATYVELCAGLSAKLKEAMA
jgi:NitT/TauT family transport system ATP-binding protein